MKCGCGWRFAPTRPTRKPQPRLRPLRPDWLVIAKDTGYTVTCLRRVPGILGLVIRETWSTDGQNLKAAADWFMPGSETGRWEVLAARPEWTEWPKPMALS